MRALPAILLMIPLVTAGWLPTAVASSPATAPADHAPDTEVASLIRQLGDDNFTTREAAATTLWAMGHDALPALRKAMTSDNPETAVRAVELVDNIELGILPDSDPKLVELIRSHAGAGINEKRRIYDTLQGMEAWRQILGLYARETDAAIRSAYALKIRYIVQRCAREELRKGEFAKASEVLQVAPADSRGLMMLAAFHQSQGTLQKELELAKNQPGPKAAAWRMALYRAAGEIDAARTEARDAGESGVEAMLAAMSGDPLPWIQLASTTQDSHPVADVYSRLAANRWRGLAPYPADLKELRSLVRSEDLQDRNAARNIMFLAGQNDIAEATLVSESPLDAFWLFHALERPDDALGVLGLDSNHMLNPGWVNQRVTTMHKEELGDGFTEGADELTTLAAFLEARGMAEEAVELFSAPLLQLATAEEPHTFIELLRKLRGADYRYQFQAATVAARIGAQWAGDDDANWSRLIDTLFDGNKLVSEWWSWTAELDPAASRPQRLEAILALLRVGSDPQGLNEQWLRRAWAAHDAAADNQKEKLRGRIARLAVAVDDTRHSLQAIGRIQDGADIDINWVEYLTHLTAAGRWDAAADLILEQMVVNDSDTVVQLHAYAAAILRRAGREKSAADHDAMAELLCLGDPRTALEIGNGYAFGLDYERARKWWWKALTYCNPSNSENPGNDNPLFQLASRCADDHMANPADWPVAASMQEFVCSLLTSRSYQWEAAVAFAQQRVKADICRLMVMATRDRGHALDELEAFHTMHVTNGVLADYFFPMLRQVGLIEPHDRWFQKSWDALVLPLKKFPSSANTRNTAAWFASRAQRKLGEAETLLAGALKDYPYQSAYLDTMAEIQFAKGDRGAALKWSDKALSYSPEDQELKRQHVHFLHDKMPASRKGQGSINHR